MTKILLVEDDKSLREIYGVRLLAEGYDIVSAGDGEEALAMAIKEKPTLIISDVMMPKISGFDMLDILRSTTETRDIKVIMMTALSSDDQRARGEQLGADKYLVKSQVGIEDVVRTVHEVLGDSAGSAPAATDTSTPPSGDAAASTAPVTDANSQGVSDTSTPADDSSQPDTNAQPTEENASTPAANTASTPVEDAPAPAPTASVSSDEGPGPLPPQPTEMSSLPQPTAPFSSPRPSHLGEQVVHTDSEAPASDTTADTSNDADVPAPSPEMSAQLNQELTASADPVNNTQFDDLGNSPEGEAQQPESALDSTSESDTPPSPEITPPEIPATPEAPAGLDTPATPDTTPPASDDTTPPSATPGPTSPSISGSSTPIS